MIRTSPWAALAAISLTLGALAPLAYAENESIVVTARSREAVQRFVESMSAAPATAEQLARWDNQICTGVAGLPLRQAEFVADRIAQRAHAVGLAPGAPNCAPNISVIVTQDASAAAQRMYGQNASLFGFQQSANITTLDQQALDDFLHSDRAVRWWHVSERRSADGMTLSGDSAQGGIANAPAARSAGSRLRNDTRQDLSQVIILVDARRVGSVQLAALADYIAMAALAQINPNAELSGYPTIMTLFAERPAGAAAPAAMTAWDVGYLDGLYHATRNAQSIQQQQSEIRQRMVSEQSSRH